MMVLTPFLDLFTQVKKSPNSCILPFFHFHLDVPVNFVCYVMGISLCEVSQNNALWPKKLGWLFVQGLCIRPSSCSNPNNFPSRAWLTLRLFHLLQWSLRRESPQCSPLLFSRNASCHSIQNEFLDPTDPGSFWFTFANVSLKTNKRLKKIESLFPGYSGSRITFWRSTAYTFLSGLSFSLVYSWYLWVAFLAMSNCSNHSSLH